MSEATQSLEDIFNDVEPVENQETEQPAQEATQQTEPGSEDITADETPEPEKEPEPEAPAAPKEPESESWTKAAVLDERRKRQALEAELAELKQAKQEPEVVPDVFDDQQKYTDHISNKISQEVNDARIVMSQEFMRMQDSEYDAKEVEFLEMAAENPQLQQQALAHAMPAKFVVETVNKARELKKLDNIDEYKAQLRAEMETKIREELQAEMGEKQKQDEKVSSIKPSLANARASKEQAEPTFESVNDLFNS